MNLVRKSWKKEVPECLPQAQEKKRVPLQPVTAPFRQLLVLVLNRGLTSPHHAQESSFNSKLKFYRNWKIFLMRDKNQVQRGVKACGVAPEHVLSVAAWLTSSVIAHRRAFHFRETWEGRGATRSDSAWTLSRCISWLRSKWCQM